MKRSGFNIAGETAGPRVRRDMMGSGKNSGRIDKNTTLAILRSSPDMQDRVCRFD